MCRWEKTGLQAVRGGGRRHGVNDEVCFSGEGKKFTRVSGCEWKVVEPGLAKCSSALRRVVSGRGLLAGFFPRCQGGCVPGPRDLVPSFYIEVQ